MLDQGMMRLVSQEYHHSALSFIPFLIPLEARLSSKAMPDLKRVTIRTGSAHWLNQNELMEVFSMSSEKMMQGKQAARIEVQADGFASTYHFNLSEAADLVLNVPLPMAGMLGAGLTRQLTYDQNSGGIHFRRQLYSGFRLYARTIDEVRPLRQFVEQAGIKVRTQEDRITQVKSLDSALSKLFMLIAGMGILGGVGALSASLYLSVERSKRQFCVLQVLGVSRSMIKLIILIQGSMIAVTGTVLATLLYLLGSRLLGQLFADAVEPGEALCRLYPSQVMQLASAVALLGAVVGILSSLRLRGLDAAAVARSE